MDLPRHVRFARALAMLAVSSAPAAAVADPPPCPPQAPRAGAVCDHQFQESRCVYHANRSDGPDDVFQCVSMPGAPHSARHWRRMSVPHPHPFLGPLPPPEAS